MEHFNTAGDIFTVHTVNKRVNNRSCLMNNVGYGFAVNQYGMGDTFCKYAFTARNTILPEDGRTVYFRDDENGDLWCVGGFPYVSKVEEFSCTHHPSKTVLSSLHEGIRVTLTFFVPKDRRCDITTVEVVNESNRPRKISVIPAYQMQLTGYSAPKFCDSLKQTYCIDYRSELGGLYLDGRNPYTDGMPYNAFLLSTVPADGYSADDREIFGFPFSLSYPYGLIEGKDLDCKPVVAGRTCLLLQHKLSLAPDEAFETDYVLGITESFENALKLTADMKTRQDIKKIYEETAACDLARRSVLSVHTPDRETNLFFNHWLKMGLEWNLLNRRATRDNLQFAHAALWYLPQATRFTLARVMEQQYQDGHTLRMWTPFVTVVYADGPLWLVTCACDYLKYTGDFAFLKEEIPYYDGGSGPAWEHLLRGIRRVMSDRGPHGLALSHFADWNDALNTGDRDPEAESVFVSMQLVLALQEMAELCDHLNETALSAEFRAEHDRLKETINRTCWDSEGYYIRSFANGKPVGASCSEGSKIYVNPQSWSIIADICPPERRQAVLDAVDRHLETPIGCKVNTPAYEQYDPSLGRISFQYPGTSENGAIYAHATGFKMYADCLLGLGSRGYQSFKKLLPSNPLNTDTVPYAISNVCSTTEFCYGKSAVKPFGTGTQAWQFRTVIEGFFGLRFGYDGLFIRPAMPEDWNEATLTLLHGETTYTFTYRRTGTPCILANGKLLTGEFLPFSHQDAVKIEITF